MKLHRLEHVQELPISLEEAWHFFSRPENLDTLTPKDMSFKILTDVAGVEMHSGMIIEYKVKPMLGISLPWVTEITTVEPNSHFVDEQRFGPFRFWHHLHRFEATATGVKMTDILHYRLPFGPLGKLVHALVVKKRVQAIFTHRQGILTTLFPEHK